MLNHDVWGHACFTCVHVADGSFRHTTSALTRCFSRWHLLVSLSRNIPSHLLVSLSHNIPLHLLGVALEVDRLLSVHGSGPSVAPGGGLSSHGPAGSISWYLSLAIFHCTSWAGAAFSYAGAAAEERLQWAAVPVAARVVSPFILSLLGASLGTLSQYSIAPYKCMTWRGCCHCSVSLWGLRPPSRGLAPTQLSLCACTSWYLSPWWTWRWALAPGHWAVWGQWEQAWGEQLSTHLLVSLSYVCTGEQLLTLKMVSISVQVWCQSKAPPFASSVQ